MKFGSNIISNKYLKQTRELYGDDLYLDFGSKLDNKISNDNHFDNKKVFQYFKKTQRELNKEFKWDSEIHMRNHADIFKKYKRLYAIKNNIFNANADENTYVDTFPKVRYEDLF